MWLDQSLGADSGLPVAQKPWFGIREISPEWAFSFERTKVHPLKVTEFFDALFFCQHFIVYFGAQLCMTICKVIHNDIRKVVDFQRGISVRFDKVAADIIRKCSNIH